MTGNHVLEQGKNQPLGLLEAPAMMGRGRPCKCGPDKAFGGWLCSLGGHLFVGLDYCVLYYRVRGWKLRSELLACCQGLIATRSVDAPVSSDL